MASNWDELERWMEGQQLPKGFEVLREPDWVEKFVRRMMTKSLPELAGKISGTGAATTKESKLFLTVVYKLPPGAERDKVRLLVKEDWLRIEGLPGGKSEKVKLPKLVKPQVCQAVVRNGELQVRLKKRQAIRKTHEHTIHWV